MTKPFWNAARAAQCRRPHKRSVLAPVACGFAELSEEAVPWLRPQGDFIACTTCGYQTCRGHEPPPAANVVQPPLSPSDKWSLHMKCEAGWRWCCHFEGSALHVLPQAMDAGDVYIVSDKDGRSLFFGTFEECRAWVERHEVERVRLELASAARDAWVEQCDAERERLKFANGIAAKAKATP